MTQKHYRHLITLVALLICLWGVLMIRGSSPWYGLQDAPRIWVPAGVRNYDIYGLDQTGLMVIRNAGPTTAENFEYYAHHPPLIIWLPAITSQFFGQNELAVRYGFIVVTLLGATMLYALTKRLYGSNVALWTLIFYGFVPMIAYYGRVPSHDLIGVLVILVFAYVMLDWLRDPTRSRTLVLIGLAWIAAWTAWTAVFFVGCLGLLAMWLGDKRHRLIVIGLGLVSVVAVIALLGFYQLQWDGTFDSIMNAFVWRASNAVDDPGTRPFTLLEFIFTTIVHTGTFGTIGLLVLSVWGIPFMLKHGTKQANLIVLALFMGFLTYQIVFRNASFVHDYYKVTLIPVMAVAGAMVVVYGWQSPLKRITRPLIASLLLLTVLHAGIFLAFIHNSGNRPWIEAAVAVLQAETTQDDLILTHLVGKDNLYPVRFYAFRNVDEAISFEDALTIADDGARIYYLACPQLDDGFVMPDGDYRSTPAGECVVYQLG